MQIKSRELVFRFNENEWLNAYADPDDECFWICASVAIEKGLPEDVVAIQIVAATEPSGTDGLNIGWYELLSFQPTDPSNKDPLFRDPEGMEYTMIFVNPVTRWLHEAFNEGLKFFTLEY